MDTIKELKVQIFDILAHQEQLAFQNQQLEQMKQELVKKLNEAQQAVNKESNPETVPR